MSSHGDPIVDWPALWLPGEPSGRVGVLMLHGLTGSPKSVEPWALGLHAHGYTVSAPVLAGHRGHWRDVERTTWRDWVESAEVELDRLSMVVDQVVVAGFSMGGAVALRLAETNPGAIRALTLVNPSVTDNRLAVRTVPLARRFKRALYVPGTDVNRPGAPRHSHDFLPLRSVESLRGLWRAVDADLPHVTVPTQILYSPNDHVVPPAGPLRLAATLSTPRTEIVALPRSFHVALWDYDSDLVTEASAAFIAAETRTDDSPAIQRHETHQSATASLPQSG